MWVERDARHIRLRADGKWVTGHGIPPLPEHDVTVSGRPAVWLGVARTFGTTDIRWLARKQCEESGELRDAVRQWGDGPTGDARTRMLDELADLLQTVANLCAALHVDDMDIMAALDRCWERNMIREHADGGTDTEGAPVPPEPAGQRGRTPRRHPPLRHVAGDHRRPDAHPRPLRLRHGRLLPSRPDLAQERVNRPGTHRIRMIRPAPTAARKPSTTRSRRSSTTYGRGMGGSAASAPASTRNTGIPAWETPSGAMSSPTPTTGRRGCTIVSRGTRQGGGRCESGSSTLRR